MNVLSWIVFGFIVGIITHLLDPNDIPRSWIWSTIFGVLGAVVGGYLSDLIFGIGVSGFNLSSFIVAGMGAILVAIVYRNIVRKI